PFVRGALFCISLCSVSDLLQLVGVGRQAEACRTQRLHREGFNLGPYPFVLFVLFCGCFVYHLSRHAFGLTSFFRCFLRTSACLLNTTFLLVTDTSTMKIRQAMCKAGSIYSSNDCRDSSAAALVTYLKYGVTSAVSRAMHC